MQEEQRCNETVAYVKDPFTALSQTKCIDMTKEYEASSSKDTICIPSRV